MSFYNLARSVAGSNADEDVISSLLDAGDKGQETAKQMLINTVKSHTDEKATLSSSHTSDESIEHKYHVQRSDSRLIYYLAGYVARKCVLPSRCSACVGTLLLPEEEGRLLHAAETVRYNDKGGLLYPSVELFSLHNSVGGYLHRLLQCAESSPGECDGHFGDD